MKTVTKKQAGQHFQAMANLAHNGETVAVTHAGQLWCQIVPPNGKRHKSAADFEARLARLFPRRLPARALDEFIECR